jgi:hypothetical protein
MNYNLNKLTKKLSLVLNYRDRNYYLNMLKYYIIICYYKRGQLLPFSLLFTV